MKTSRYLMLLGLIVLVFVIIIVVRAERPNKQATENVGISSSTTTPLSSENPPIIAPEATKKEPNAVSAITTEKLLNTQDINVPYTPQAPTANWDAFHDEACEEASSIMVWHYFNHTSIQSTDQVENELSDAAAWERANVGTDVSVPADDVVKMLRDHFQLDAVTLKNPTVTDFKQQLSDKHLIIVPAQGQQLHNPYFRQPGPRYHMFVVRGYDASGNFITNDPGTKRGEKYQYDPNILFNAMHDWNGGDVDNGQKVAIVVNGLLK